MTTFRLPIEMLALPLCGDDKRCVRFRTIHNMTPTGVERQFGFAEYLYCEIHRTWHEQKHNAYIPLTEWSKLVSYSQYVAARSERVAEQEVSERSNVAASSRKDQPFPEYCDGQGYVKTVGCGCATAGTPKQH